MNSKEKLKMYMDINVSLYIGNLSMYEDMIVVDVHFDL
jgi:hypothetical protein